MAARGVLLVFVFVFGLVGCAANPARPSSVPDVAYCAEAIRHWQVMDCPPARLLSAEVQARRTTTFRVTRDARRRVVLAEAINGAGRLIATGSEDIASWSYAYEDDGDIPIEITLKDRHGRIAAFLRVRDAGAKVDWLDANRKLHRRGPTTFTTTHVEYDDRGRELRTRSFNGRGAPARDEDAVYGYDNTLTDDGLVSGWTAIGADGKPSAQKRWSTSVRIVRDAEGRRTGRRPMDASGAPIVESNGIAGFDQELDEVGNLVRQTNLGVDGRPRVDDRGVAIVTYERDARGEAVRARFLDVDGKPVLSKQGSGGWDSKVDERGNVVSFDVVDARGSVTLGVGGFARRVAVYDDADRVIEERFLDVAGGPTTAKSGVSSVATTYDARGNVTEVRNFDRKGRLVRSKDGWAIRVCTYDDADRQTSCSTLDASRRPALVRDGWYSHFDVRYDDNGDEIEWLWSAEGASGPPRVHGGSRLVTTRDELGSRTGEAYFDEKGAPVATAIDGFARVGAEYDESGSVTKGTYFAADGSIGKVVAITLDPHGWTMSVEETGPSNAKAKPVFRTAYDRDARGQVVGISYFGGDGAPVLSESGIARVERDLDANGRMLRERQFGLDGKPLEGVAGVDRTYDAYGREISETWVDGAGAPVLTATKWTTKRTAYDARGNVVEHRWLDPNGALVAPHGYAIERYERDRFGGAMSYRVFDEHEDATLLPGQKSHGWQVEIDDRGNTTLSIRLDVNRKVLAGFLLASMRYDENDALAETRFLDADDKPAINVEGVAIIRYENDDRGHRVRERYFDPSGKPVTTRAGVGARRFAYDEPTGKRVEEVCVGADGQPVDNEAGWSRRQDVWGEDGKSTATYFSASGAEVTPTAPAAE